MYIGGRMRDERARGLCWLDEQNSPDAIFRLAQRSKTRPRFELMAYSGILGQTVTWSFYFVSKKFSVCVYTIPSLCSAFSCGPQKRGWSEHRNRSDNRGLGFSLIFMLTRFKFGGEQLAKKMGDALVTRDLLSATRLPGVPGGSMAEVDLK